MSLRCFKGPLDGERREVHCEIVCGRVVEFALRYRMPVPTKILHTPATMSIKRAAYRIERLATRNKTWHFLIYAGVETEEVFDELFE